MTTFAKRLPQYMHLDECDKMDKGDRNVNKNLFSNNDERDQYQSSEHSSEGSDFDEWNEDGSDSDSITSYDTNRGGKESRDEDVEDIDLEELSRMRHNSVQKLRTSWERVIRQYGHKRVQIESSNGNSNTQRGDLEPIPAIGRSWKPAHSVVPPLSRFQGSSGFMIAPEWQIILSEEHEEDGWNEEDDDEDIIDFEAKDWEKKLQNSSYFVERIENLPGKGEAQVLSVSSEFVSRHSSSSGFVPIYSSRNRQQNTCEQIETPKNLSSLKRLRIDNVRNYESSKSPWPKRQRIEYERVPVKTKTPNRPDNEVRHSTPTSVKYNSHRYSSSKLGHQISHESKQENHRPKTISPKKSKQKTITNFMASSKPKSQMSLSLSSSQCKGRNECTKSFCLICGSFTGLGSGTLI